MGEVGVGGWKEGGGGDAERSLFVAACGVYGGCGLFFECPDELAWVLLNTIDHQVDTGLGDLFGVLGVGAIHIECVLTRCGIEGTDTDKGQDKQYGDNNNQSRSLFRGAANAAVFTEKSGVAHQAASFFI